MFFYRCDSITVNCLEKIDARKNANDKVNEEVIGHINHNSFSKVRTFNVEFGFKGQIIKTMGFNVSCVA